MIARISRSFVRMALLAALAAMLLPGLGGVSASAADGPTGVTMRPLAPRAYVLPFPRSERAQSVWASGACWSECGSYCAWGEAACLERDTQGQCLKLTDDCDRTCQRSCRTSGGPYLPLDF